MKRMKVSGILLLAVFLATVFSCDEALLTPRGQWNPEDPDYEKATDPDYTDERSPRMPVDFTAEAVSHEQVDLSWTDQSDNEDAFIVERKAAGVDEYTEVHRTEADTESWIDTTVTYLTGYTYRICSFNAYGSSEYTAAMSVSVPQAPGSPAAPSSLSATAASDTAVDLSWTDNADDETAFYVERSENGVDFTQVALLDGADHTSHQDTELYPSTSYYYRVRAWNSLGFSGYSNEAEVITLGPPAAPENLAATTYDDGQIDLSWTDNAVNELSFRVERNSGGGYSPVAYPNADETSYSDTGLTQNTTYTYRVIAHNDYGDSDPSNEDSATTQGVPTEAPSGLTATVYSANEIRLAWTDNSSNESGFLVEYLSGSWLEVTTTAAGATSYNHQGLDGNTSYSYRVTAVNTYGEAGPSNTDSDTTLNWSIGDVVTAGVAGYNSSIDLDWSGNPYIAYVNGTAQDLMYVYWTGSAWSTPETVDATGTAGYYVAMKLDSSGVPHIAYLEQGSRDLKYATKPDTTWELTTLDSANYVWYDLDLVLDSSGYPHISYTARNSSSAYTDGDLCYAYYDGSNWYHETINTMFTEAGRDNAIAVHTDGTVHILYETAGRLHHAYGTYGTWTVNEQVDTVGERPDVALDSAGNVYVSFYDGQTDNLMYAKKTGSWSTPVNIDTGGYVGLSSSIDVDSSGYPHISYIYQGEGGADSNDLRYASWNGSSWSIITVDSTANVSGGSLSDMVLDSGGNAHISYYEDSTDDLKYAEEN